MGWPNDMPEESYALRMVTETRDIAIRLDKAIRGNGGPGLAEQVRRNSERIEELRGAGVRFWAKVAAVVAGVSGLIELVHWLSGG